MWPPHAALGQLCRAGYCSLSLAGTPLLRHDPPLRDELLEPSPQPLAELALKSYSPDLLPLPGKCRQGPLLFLTSPP